MTTPGAPDTQGARPPGNPTLRCLLPTAAKCGDLEDELFSVLCIALLQSVEFEEALDRLFSHDCVTSVAPTRNSL